MAHYIEYSDLESPETVQKALDDCMDWLGKAQYEKVCAILAADKGQSPRHHVRLGLMMQGIQGYPAEALMKTFWEVA